MIVRTALLALLALSLRAQPSASMLDGWRKPFPAHRIAGNVYYVGTYDLGCFLITTPEGHILINTGLVNSVPLIRAGVQTLGFRFEDIKLLLTMQAHYDHVAAMAEVKRLTGARMFATEGDAPVLEDGGKSDFHFGKENWFPPVKVDHIIKDGEKIKLGGAELTAHLTPGHTKGSVTYSLSTADAGRTYRVLFANMGTINPGVVLVGNKKYPGIAEDYARTFRVEKALACDVFVSAHSSMYQLHSKYQPGDPYEPNRFVDPDGYKSAVARYEQIYLTQLDSERTAAKAGFK